MKSYEIPSGCLLTCNPRRRVIVFAALEFGPTLHKLCRRTATVEQDAPAIMITHHLLNDMFDGGVCFVVTPHAVGWTVSKGWEEQ